MDTSAGINIIKNIIRAYPIYLDDDVALSLSYSKSRIKSELDNYQVKVVIHVDFETMVKEVNVNEDIFRNEALNNITEMQNDYIINIMKKATNYSTSSGRDILQIARLVQNQHTKKWSEIEGEWDNMISDIQYEFDVKSKVTKSFILGVGSGGFE